MRVASGLTLDATRYFTISDSLRIARHAVAGITAASIMEAAAGAEHRLLTPPAY
jgi:hypothetical protein